MRAQRVRDAENRIEMQIAKWTAEGTVKSSVAAEYSVTWGIRQLPEIGEYLAKRMDLIHESRWHRGSVIPVLDRFYFSVKDGFF